MSALTSQKKWLIKAPNPQLQVTLSDALGIHPLVAQLLINREIVTPEDARLFFSSDLKNLHDPFLMKDMDIAVERIKKAQQHKETVLIFGDYDVDGVTSSAILHNALRRMGIPVINYIPHRIHDGYGLNHEVGSLAKENNVSLLIAVDCGIGANSEVESLNNLGIDVIIVDHHLPSEGPLPKAVAIVNPKRADCGYPFKHLAAVGLVAKLTQALFGEIMEDELDLVAIGTIADVVPLRGENRIFVQNGLPRINQTKNKGLLALLDVAKIKSKKILPRYVGFIIGPRINATGRMDSAQKSLDLLLSKDGEQAYALANFLEKLNTDRQKIQEEIVQEAMSVVEREINFKEHKVIVINKKGWHIGVLGIVASRIAETYYRPTVVVSVNDGVGTASARSIPGFHLYEALTYCAETLESYGGHQGAAGLTIQEDKIDSFRDMINQYASDKVDGDYLKPSLELDCEVPLSLLDLDLVEIIDTMEPYGEGNPPPYFYTRNLIVKSQPSVLGKDTLKFWVSDGSRTISVVGFKMGKYREFVNLGQRVDLAYQLAIDDWNKAPTVQLKLKDMKLSEG